MFSAREQDPRVTAREMHLACVGRSARLAALPTSRMSDGSASVDDLPMSKMVGEHAHIFNVTVTDGDGSSSRVSGCSQFRLISGLLRAMSHSFPSHTATLVFLPRASTAVWTLSDGV